MGGPGGVTGQPSTWITQLVEKPLRRTEGPGVGVNKHSQPAATQTRRTGVRTLASFTHTDTHTQTHTPQALSRLVASALSGHTTPRWIQSAPLSVNGEHAAPSCTRVAAASHSAEGESVLSFLCDFLFPPRLPSPLPRPCQPCPLSLSAAIWLPPPQPHHVIP